MVTVYVIERSTDYESSQIKGVLDNKEFAEHWTLTNAENEAEKAFVELTMRNSKKVSGSNNIKSPAELIVKLPCGYKVFDIAFTYEEFEIQPAVRPLADYRLPIPKFSSFEDLRRTCVRYVDDAYNIFRLGEALVKCKDALASYQLRTSVNKKSDQKNVVK
jgi:hypothetical protein